MGKPPKRRPPPKQKQPRQGQEAGKRRRSAANSPAKKQAIGSTGITKVPTPAALTALAGSEDARGLASATPVGLSVSTEAGRPIFADPNRPAEVISNVPPAQTVNLDLTVNRFPSANLQGIAADLRSIVPLLLQLVEAQSKLGGNAAASVVQLPSDAPRIAELTATTLDEEARSDKPRMHVVEQCLRVGKMLLLAAMKVIASVVLTIDGNLSYEALTDPEQAMQHAQTIVATIEHVLHLCGQ
jgi:hypothetical protein